MPIPVTAWNSEQFPSAKFLNLALATSDGTGDHPTGTVFLAARPILLEAYTTAATFTTSPAGTQSVMSTSGNTTSCMVNYDTAGLYGKSSDLPGFGYYQFTAAVPGSAGDGKNAGGWMLLGHLPAIRAVSTQTGAEAGWQQVGGSFTAGSRQATSAAYDSAPFALDLINVGSVGWQPAVNISDSASANATAVVNVTDPSGETCRMFAVWAAVSATTSGLAQFAKGGVSGWTCPAGVTQVTVAAIGGGAGGGAGNASAGGLEYGGGGGGGGQFSTGTVAVTAGNVYTVTVGAGGGAGVSPGGNGGAGGLSFFSGDAASVTAAGGSAGAGATLSGDGAGGAGGGGSSGGALFTAAGPGTWKAPTGVTSIMVECWGAGGAGYGATTSTVGGGGGGGEYAAEATVAVTPGTTYSFTAGSPGAPASGGAGTSGGATTFSGDALTITANGGGAGTSGTGGGGAGGTGSANTTHYDGGAGSGSGTAGGGGGGGSSAGTASAGNPGTTSGTGGLAVPGGGPGGDGTDAGGGGGHAPASGPGGGGGAAGGTNSGTASGGAGYAGQIRLSYTTGTTGNAGGNGNTGTTASSGGGGGSSASSSGPGINATDGTGAPAPSGGGPGGDGGKVAITVVQSGRTSNTGSKTLTAQFGSPVQAGNAIIACVDAQGSGNQNNPTLALSDGTALTSTTSTSLGNGTVVGQFGVYGVFGVTGGQTGLKLTSQATGDLVNLVQWWEVSGLGPSPNADASNSATGSNSTYDVTQATTGAPDFWVGVTGVISGHSSPTINSPGSQWTTFPQESGSSGGVAARLRAGYEIQDTAGTMTYKGSISGSGLIWGSIVAAYTTSVPTPGSAPVIGPGGGGGGGLGANNGGAGLDGQVILTWTGASGSGYGTPASPQPYPSWSASTTVGTGPGNDVDINGPAGITDVVNYLTSPPVFRIADTSAPSVPSATLTPVSFAGDSATVDTYAGWSSGSYRVQRSGIYLFHGLACFAVNATGTRQAGVTVNGITYWGPGYAAAAAGATHATKTIVLSLVAGDTVSLAVRQDSGSALTLSATSATRFFLTWLCAAGAPQGNWVPPDTTYQWVSGTSPADLPGLFQDHIANDLGFLVNRPYLLAYQSVAQSGLTVGAFSTLTMDTVSGIVHGDNGDPWSGWTPGPANAYAAPVDGWYLTVAEYLTGPSSSSGATVTAGIQPSASGGVSPAHPVDWWQANVATASASVGSGATAVGLSYALAGETLTPVVMGSGFPAAYPTLTGTQNSGFAASSFAAVWISN